MPATPVQHLAALFGILVSGFNGVFFGHPFAVLGFAVPSAALVINTRVCVHPDHSGLRRRLRLSCPCGFFLATCGGWAAGCLGSWGRGSSRAGRTGGSRGSRWCVGVFTFFLRDFLALLRWYRPRENLRAGGGRRCGGGAGPGVFTLLLARFFGFCAPASGLGEACAEASGAAVVAASSPFFLFLLLFG